LKQELFAAMGAFTRPEKSTPYILSFKYTEQLPIDPINASLVQPQVIFQA